MDGPTGRELARPKATNQTGGRQVCFLGGMNKKKTTRTRTTTGVLLARAFNPRSQSSGKTTGHTGTVSAWRVFTSKKPMDFLGLSLLAADWFSQSANPWMSRSAQVAIIVPQKVPSTLANAIGGSSSSSSSSSSCELNLDLFGRDVKIPYSSATPIRPLSFQVPWTTFPLPWKNHRRESENLSKTRRSPHPGESKTVHILKIGHTKSYKNQEQGDSWVLSPSQMVKSFNASSSWASIQTSSKIMPSGSL